MQLPRTVALVAAVGLLAGTVGAWLGTRLTQSGALDEPVAEATNVQQAAVGASTDTNVDAAPPAAPRQSAPAASRAVRTSPAAQATQASVRAARREAARDDGPLAAAAKDSQATPVLEGPGPSPVPSQGPNPAPSEPLGTSEPSSTTARAEAPARDATPGPTYEDVELPAQSVMGVQLERSISSETARVEDEVVGRVTRDVRVDGRIVIPAGARTTGTVVLVERGGRLKDRARIGFTFTSVALPDGMRVALHTETIYREGDSPRSQSSAKIGGGAIGGAIIGGILGGAKGAAIGGSIGAGAGSAAVLAGGRNAAVLPAGSPLTVRLERPVVITLER